MLIPEADERSIKMKKRKIVTSFKTFIQAKYTMKYFENNVKSGFPVFCVYSDDELFHHIWTLEDHRPLNIIQI